MLLSRSGNLSNKSWTVHCNLAFSNSRFENLHFSQDLYFVFFFFFAGAVKNAIDVVNGVYAVFGAVRP